MAEIIRFDEIQAERQRRRAPNRENLRHAVEILKYNLADVAERLCEAPAAEQPDLLDRVEKLADMIRYGLIMLGEVAAPSGRESEA